MALENLDRMVGEVFAVYGGIDRFLEQFTIIITGDHAQSEISAEKERASIDVESVLSKFSLAPLAEPWTDDAPVVVCPNMRTLLIYHRQPTASIIHQIADALLTHKGVDQVMWREDVAGDANTGSKTTINVITSGRGRLRFWLASATTDVDATADAFIAIDALGLSLVSRRRFECH